MPVPKLVLCALANKIIIDGDTNSFSLIDIVSNVTAIPVNLSTEKLQNFGAEYKYIIPNMEFCVIWQNDTESIELEFDQMMGIRAPDGKVTHFPDYILEINAQVPTFLRTRQFFPPTLLRMGGTYHVLACTRLNKRDEWKEVATYPFAVLIQDMPEQPRISADS